MSRSNKSAGNTPAGKSRRSGTSKANQPVDPPFGRLCLVTPPLFDPQDFAPRLEGVLARGDVASLFIIAEGLDAAALARATEQLVPIAQANGVAAIASSAALIDRTGADGLDVSEGLASLVEAAGRLRPAHIVGASNIHSRHEAMLLAETECDYLFFGRFDGDGDPAIHDKTLDLAAWWSALFEIPAIVMGGRDLASVREAVEARIEFIALRRAVWDHPAGPEAAIAEASRLVLALEAEARP